MPELTELQRRTFVRCPPPYAAAYLKGYVVDAGGGCVRCAFRSRVFVPALATEIALEHAVVVTLALDAREGGASDRVYRVAWMPADDGPFPRLAGTLDAYAADESAACFLVLRGYYETPLRIANGLRESGLAHRIAQATARDLLALLARYLERSHAKVFPSSS